MPSEDKTHSQVVIFFPLVGALWACATLTLNVTQHLNRIRDVVLTGLLNGKPISVRHANIMIDSDWVSMFGFIVSVNMAFGILICLCPLLIDRNTRSKVAWWLCAVVSAIPIVMGILWLWFGLKDLTELYNAVSGDVYPCFEPDIAN